MFMRLTCKSYYIFKSVQDMLDTGNQQKGAILARAIRLLSAAGSLVMSNVDKDNTFCRDHDIHKRLDDKHLQW